MRKVMIREGRLERKGNNKEHQAFLTRVKRTYEEIKLKLRMHVATVGLTHHLHKNAMALRHASVKP